MSMISSVQHVPLIVGAVIAAEATAPAEATSEQKQAVVVKAVSSLAIPNPPDPAALIAWVQLAVLIANLFGSFFHKTPVAAPGGVVTLNPAQTQSAG